MARPPPPQHSLLERGLELTVHINVTVFTTIVIMVMIINYQAPSLFAEPSRDPESVPRRARPVTRPATYQAFSIFISIIIIIIKIVIIITIISIVIIIIIIIAPLSS